MDPTNKILLSNRAAAYLGGKKFEKALDDANSVLEMDPKHAKCALRKAKSLAGLKLYEDCADFIRDQIKVQPEVASNANFRSLIDAANASIAGQSTDQ